MPLSAGDKLGPCEILASIGAGGMGDVYRARDPRLNRDVTIKVSDGQIDLAADWFEKAIEERYSLVVMILQSAIGEPLRASPRWPKLAALMNLPEAES